MWCCGGEETRSFNLVRVSQQVVQTGLGGCLIQCPLRESEIRAEVRPLVAGENPYVLSQVGRSVAVGLMVQTRSCDAFTEAM